MQQPARAPCPARRGGGAAVAQRVGPVAKPAPGLHGCWSPRARSRPPRPPAAPPAASAAAGSGGGAGPDDASSPPPNPNPSPPPPWWLPPLPSSPRDLLPTRGAWPALQRAAQLALANAWALATLSTARDAATFLLHRLSQGATNASAAALLGDGCAAALSTAAPNPWWICLDAAFLEAFPAYQALVAIFFALALPASVAVNAAAAAAAVVLCTSRRGADGRLLLPRRRAGVVATAVAADGKRRRRRQGSDEGPLAVGPGAWWAAEPWRGGGPEAGCNFASSSGAGRSGAASFGGAARAARAAAAAEGAATAASASAAAAAPRIIQPRLPLTRLPLGPLKGPTHGLAAAMAAARAVLATPGLLRRAWCADLLASAQSVPLQALALAVVPAPWAVPRLLAIQLAVPAAVLAGGAGRADAADDDDAAADNNSPPLPAALPAPLRRALASGQRSVQLSIALMRDFRASYAWPFVAAYALGRLLEASRDALMRAVPPRWWADVPEIPLAATALFVVARFLVARAVELLPLAVYLERASEAVVAVSAAEKE